jgi:hypothetical protein
MFSKNSQNLMRYAFIARESRFLSTSKQTLNVKPFYYQELFEHANELNTPFKKLTGNYSHFVLLNHFIKSLKVIYKCSN